MSTETFYSSAIPSLLSFKQFCNEPIKLICARDIYLPCLQVQVSLLLFFWRRLVGGTSTSWGEARDGLGAARWFQSERAGARRSAEGCTQSHKTHRRNLQVKGFLQESFGMCFTMAQSPRQGAALCVSTGSLSPFQHRPAVGEGCVRFWQRLRRSYRNVPNIKLFLWPS